MSDNIKEALGVIAVILGVMTLVVFYAYTLSKSLGV
jgi:hypothetical protein